MTPSDDTSLSAAFRDLCRQSCHKRGLEALRPAWAAWQARVATGRMCTHLADVRLRTLNRRRLSRSFLAWQTLVVALGVQRYVLCVDRTRTLNSRAAEERVQTRLQSEQSGRQAGVFVVLLLSGNMSWDRFSWGQTLSSQM